MKCEQLAHLLKFQNKALERTLEGGSFYNIVYDLLKGVDELEQSVSSVCMVDRNSKSLTFAAAPNLSSVFQEAYSKCAILPKSGPCMASVYFNESVYFSDLTEAKHTEQFKKLAASEGLSSSWSSPIYSQMGQLIGVFSLFSRKTQLDQSWAREVFDVIAKTLALMIARERENCLSLCNRMNTTEEEFRLLAEVGPQMPFIADGEGNIIYYNQKFYDYVGRGDDICGWNWQDTPIHHPDDLAETLEKWRECVRLGVPYQSEYRLRRHDGEYRWHLGRALPVKDVNGKVIRWYGANVEIHDQRTMADRLELAISAAQLGFWESDLINQKISWNERMGEMFGFDVGKLSGDMSEMSDKIHPEDRVELEKILEQFLANHNKYSLEFRIVPRAGEVCWVECHGEIYRDENHRPIKIVGAALDITARKRDHIALKKAKEVADNANEAKSRFLANMSHEIRTPIGVILGYTELLQMTKPTEAERSEYYDVILNSCRGLTRIVDDILDLSKVEAGRLELESRQLSFDSCLDEIYETFKDIAKNKGLELNLHRSSRVPAFLRSDGARIKQVLINLVSNAIKFTPKGVVDIHVDARDLEDGKSEIFVDIIDTGIGLSSEQQKNLFKPFSQADSSTSRKFGGTGLGLALSRRLAIALGGNIEILKSQVKQGSTFRFNFVALKSNHISEKLPFEQALTSFELKGLKLLIAEDVEKNQFLIKKILSQAGATIDLVSNGVEAIDRATHNIYDLILMDIQMPELDGREATRILRDSGYKKPIIALTAHAMVEERKMNIQAGCNDYLTKPIDVNKLVHTIRRHCSMP